MKIPSSEYRLIWVLSGFVFSCPRGRVLISLAQILMSDTYLDRDKISIGSKSRLPKSRWVQNLDGHLNAWLHLVMIWREKEGYGKSIYKSQCIFKQQQQQQKQMLRSITTSFTDGPASKGGKFSLYCLHNINNVNNNNNIEALQLLSRWPMSKGGTFSLYCLHNINNVNNNNNIKVLQLFFPMALSSKGGVFYSPPPVNT